MALIKLAERNIVNDADILKKAQIKKKTTTTVKGGSGLLDKIAMAEKLVNGELGKYAEESILIQTKEDLHDYISKCLNNHIISIDTETTGLDPLQNDIVGFSIYTPNEKTAYIPINHISYINRLKVPNQLPVEVCKDELQRVADSHIDVIMFNAAFDTRVIKNKIGVRLVCTWDCYLAARCLNENEPTNALKPLHKKYVNDGEGDAFKFDDLFKGISFDLVPIKVAYLYAAHDSKITYDLYDYQRKYLFYDPAVVMSDRNGMNGVGWVFHNIEMPCVQAVVDMEDTGVEFDFEYNKALKDKYHSLLNEKMSEFYAECDKYQDKIQSYRNTAVDNVLDNPINISSPKQLSVLLYDVLKLPCVVDKRTKKEVRGTGEEILKELKHPICNAILAYRTLEKLVSTYIDKMPECVNPNDGRIHCKFNQYGADTGRFSSQDPNMQNIPSHNKDIRKMFKATDEEVYVSECNNSFAVSRWCEVNTTDGWKHANAVKEGDSLIVDDNGTECMLIVNKIDTLIDKNQIVYYY